MFCIKCYKEIPDDSNFCNYCGRSQLPPPPHPKRRGNGQGTVVKRPNGRYRATVTLAYYTDADGNVHRKTVSRDFIKKSDAVAALPSMHEVHEAPEDMTLHDLHALYTASRDYSTLSKSQKDKMLYAWRRLAPFEFRGIATLTVAEMEDLIESSVETYYPARDMKVMLSHLYLVAVKKEVVPRNKTEYVDIPYDAPKAKREVWSEEHINAMWEDYESHPFTAYPLIMCYAGLRYGELSELLLENIHLNERYMIGGIKTEAGINREIPIAARIAPLIARMSEGKKRKLLEMNDDNWYEKYWDMVHRLNLPEYPPRVCRHYYFSQLTAAGIQSGIITETGGHASYMTTIKNYVRIPLADKLSAVDKIK